MQTCENDTFASEIHTHVSRFLNIFLLRYAQCVEHTPDCDFNTHNYDFNTHEYDYDTHECDLCTQSKISTRRVWFPHAEWDFQTQSVIPTLTGVVLSHTSVFLHAKKLFWHARVLFWHKRVWLDTHGCSVHCVWLQS
jgi:hypothetical protein